ncbi:response regulator [Paenibacillus sp. HW567]|uniref:response regulator n=1 Tax=Paenibacillus sp. HW567 TaxID=1034769 RepID=UPI00037DD290|nr:response regulator [Paenibacillus sp. HW567]
MRKLVILDDDQIILRRLSKGIAWKQHGFELVAAHTNGEDGLAAIEQERPQIVLTDIRMPFMDGLELTELLKERYADIQIIMMTSYDEFEFAQKALKLKVFDFILKPLDEDRLIETVNRAAEEWEREHVLAKKVMEGVPLLKQRFLENLLYRRYKQEEIERELAFLDLDLHCSRYSVILLLADEYYETGAQSRYSQELLKYCIHNVAEEVLQGEGGTQCTGGNGSLVFESIKEAIVILYGHDQGADDSVLERGALLLAELIRCHVETYLKTTVTVGIGPVVNRLEELALSYRGALAATEYRHLTGTNQVFLYRDSLIHTPVEIAPGEMAGWEVQLSMKIKAGLEQETLTVIDRLEEEIRVRANVSLDRLHLFGMEMAFILINAFSDWKEPPYPRNAAEILFDEIRRLRTAKEIFDHIRIFVIKLSAAVRERRCSQQNHLADQAVAYIREWYGKEGLSLQEVADHVHVSTTYLSTIFKKITGVNFSDFLTETRLQAAMEWLGKENLKTYEVAERVGYGNPQYFSVSFKKHTGMTPSEFRQSR